VHGGADPMALDERVHRGLVAHVCALEHRRAPEQPRQPLEHTRRAVTEVVDAHHVVAGRLERNPGVRADVAGRAGEQDGVSYHEVEGPQSILSAAKQPAVSLS
jgi:hypothetical protein